MSSEPVFNEQSIAIDDVLLRVSTGGSGRPLVMLNGLGASLEVLAPLRRALGDFRTITFDPPGVGGSGPLRMPMRLPRHAAVLARLLDKLGIERFDLFGVSWGGALAQEFTLRYPNRVDRLILASTTAGPALLATPKVYLAFLDPRTRTSEKYVERVAPTLFGGKVRQGARSLLTDGIFHNLAHKRSKAYLYQMAAAVGWSSLPYLWRLRQPTLIVTGDDDPLIRPYNSRLLKLVLPNARLRIIRGEGHLLIVTSAKPVAELIRAHLDRGEEQARAA